MTVAGRCVIAFALLGFAVSGCAVERSEKEKLTQLYTPRFAPPPPAEAASVTIRKLIERLRTPPPSKSRSGMIPDQAGVLWLALLAALVAGFDFRRLVSRRNIDLLLMQALGWCFYDILVPLDHLSNPTERNIIDWTFTVIFAISLALLARALRRVVRPERVRWLPSLDGRPLRVLAVAFVLADIGVALYSPPDDAGYFINIGAQRFRERLQWPYGDPLLSGTPAAAYGPVLYAAHIPFQLVLAPAPVNPISPARPAIASGEAYYLPPLLATKLCTIAFHLLAVWALFAAVRRLADARAAWGLVTLYCSSAFVLGVGDDAYSIGGMTFTSHIAPAALTLLAFAFLHRPAASGAALAAATGALFYPVFMVPAWLGYYWGRPEQLKKFLVGFGCVALVIGASVLLQSRPADGRSRVGTILYDTIGHQESPEAYGNSPFGFWGQRQGIRARLMQPLVGTQSMSRPIVLLFFLFAAAMFVVAQRRGPAQFALIVAAVAIGAQLWKIHATGTYVTWYYPFLLVGFLCGPGAYDETHA